MEFYNSAIPPRHSVPAVRRLGGVQAGICDEPQRVATGRRVWLHVPSGSRRTRYALVRSWIILIVFAYCFGTVFAFLACGGK